MGHRHPRLRAHSLAPERLFKPRHEIRLDRLTPGILARHIRQSAVRYLRPETIPQLNSIVTQIEPMPSSSRRVPERSAGLLPDALRLCFSAFRDDGHSPGATGLPALPDMLVRLSRARSCRSSRSAAALPGRQRAVLGERHALRQPREGPPVAVGNRRRVGAWRRPDGRLPRLIGRGRALEVLLSGEDIPGDLAERYGYVNRALPDAELDQFVDALPGASPGLTSSPSPTSSAWSTSRACRRSPRSAPNGTRSWPRRSARRPSRTSSA